jgi:hypothetical protein
VLALVFFPRLILIATAYFLVLKFTKIHLLKTE